jgi:hypothetical protein
MNAERLVIFALVWQASSAIAALIAMQARRDDDAVTLAHVFHARANPLDRADTFVTEYYADLGYVRGRHGKDI